MWHETHGHYWKQKLERSANIYYISTCITLIVIIKEWTLSETFTYRTISICLHSLLLMNAQVPSMGLSCCEFAKVIFYWMSSLFFNMNMHIKYHKMYTLMYFISCLQIYCTQWMHTVYIWMVMIGCHSQRPPIMQ